MLAKTCRTCGLTKPIESFYKKKGGRLGTHARCIVCTRAAAAHRYQDPEKRKKINSSSRKWQLANREKDAAAHAAWRLRHRKEELFVKKVQILAARELQQLTLPPVDSPKVGALIDQYREDQRAFAKAVRRVLKQMKDEEAKHRSTAADLAALARPLTKEI